jgi:hypothetical protein
MSRLTESPCERQLRLLIGLCDKLSINTMLIALAARHAMDQ